MDHFNEGQRWISESEPELGLGTLVQLTPSRVSMLFPASGELRQYARDNAPLKRVRFREGDTIKSHDDESLVVESVRESDGVITYLGGGRELPEAQLSDSLSFHGADERLLSGQIDDAEDFELRYRALKNLHRTRKSPVRGFVGGRIDLIPHQLYIAHEVSSRHAPRVLLSDEVGLGKTIEACLILHRLILNGRAARILILVPESLVHQWFVEMLRKFNFWFSIFDEERCASIEAGNPESNPFLDEQLVLCSLGFLSGSPTRSRQALGAEWDVLVVDEAHHLEWAPDRSSNEYLLVEALGAKAEGLLLLTATPEQLGPESHFARLRLLDPDRYQDIERMKSDAKQYRSVADIAMKLQGDKKLTKKDVELIATTLHHDRDGVASSLKAIMDGDRSARKILLEDLLDLHGPGRVVFRNTRTAMQGFPKRLAKLAPIPISNDRAEWIDRVSTEFAVDAGDRDLALALNFEDDPRTEWLAELLQSLELEKVLLICRSIEKAMEIDRALRLQLNIKVGVFHEDLPLVQRDRNAAWFADEEGARLLICSEIGSEGRNFQFAHHIVLFDLPLNPELLEQRIGRLDRIGQTEDIQIHVPYLKGSPQEVLCRWYHDGLNAFETNLEGGNELLRQFGRQVHDLALEYPVKPEPEAAAELAELIEKSAKARDRLVRQLEQGRDRLLELNSFRPEIASSLVETIGEVDREDHLLEFMLDVFERFGVHAEELGHRTHYLNPQGVITEAFPAIPEKGTIATCDRKRALGREDVCFLSWDHPMVTGAMDLLLGSEKGNSSFGVLPDPDERSLLLETVFVLETVADPKLHVDRFMPATPLRVVVNRQRDDVTAAHPESAFANLLKKGNPFALLDNPTVSQKILPAMIKSALGLAEQQGQTVLQSSLRTMNLMLDHELERLKTLQEVNDHVRPVEIELAVKQQENLSNAIQGARVRLDAVRLIWKGPPEALG